MQDLALYDTTLSSDTVLEHYERGENTYRVANTTAPSIEGTPQDGQTLTANPGAWSGFEPISYAYQWQSCNLLGKECHDIAEATEDSYLLSAGDEETTVGVVVKATNAGSLMQAVSSASATVEGGPPSELQAPSISGTPIALTELHADPGQWGGSETELLYQWESCSAEGTECAPITGATDSGYSPGESDIGTTLRIRIGASNGLGSVTALSDATPEIGSATLENSVAPTISGKPQVGQSLALSVGSWLGKDTIEYGYQWQRCDREGDGCNDIEGATSASYVLAPADAGGTVRARVMASSTVDGSVSQTTATTQPVAAEAAPMAEAAPGISGTGLVGQALSATPGSWSVEGATSYAYQWERCDQYGEGCSPIAAATAGSYTLTEADAGSTVRSLVTATDSGGATEASSTPITVTATSLSNISSPAILGLAEVGWVLSAAPGIWTGAGALSYAYQWERCNAEGTECASIAGATEASYTPRTADGGHTLELVVTASTASEETSVASAPTYEISSEPTSPENVAGPSIEGNATAGETLTANPGSWSGSEPISYSYQWRSCDEDGEECTDIIGATGETYLLGIGDIGSTLRVTVTASNSIGEASAGSSQSEVIGSPGPPANTQAPLIHGIAQEGQQLFADNGGWSGSRPLSYFYRWERCDGSGEECTAIEGATTPSYTPTSSDVASTLRLKVTASNSLGSVGALSAATTVVAASGEASISQALEIAEETDPSVVAPATSASLEEETVKPAESDTGEALSSEAALTSSSVSKETPGEFAVNTPNGELSLTPIGTALNATTTPTIVNDAAALFAGTSNQTDTIVRPDALGATTLLQLRSSAAPTSFSWEVRLGAEQRLQQLSDGSMAVVEPTSGSYLEGELPSEGLEGAGEETGGEAEGEAYGSDGAGEELGGAHWKNKPDRWKRSRTHRPPRLRKSRRKRANSTPRTPRLSMKAPPARWAPQKLRPKAHC
jgi:hypothetical protein